MSHRLGALVLVVALVSGACTSAEDASAAFCDKLGEVTGPTGVESVLLAGDPARIDGVVDELAELHDRAPEEISATTRTLLNFFRSYQRAARDERRDVIAENADDLAQASDELDAYALAQCGLFLERTVPTPLPAVNPGIETPNE